MINVIVSKYPRNTSIYTYKKIEKDLEKGQRALLIVPEQYTLQTDVEFIETIKADTVMDAKVLSFRSLSRFIIDRVGASSEDVLSPNAKIMLINSILKDLNNELITFKDNYNDVDFSGNLANLIGEFKDNRIALEDFDKIEASDLPARLKAKFKDLKLIYESYQKEIAGKFIDTEDRLMTVIEKISEADFLREYKFYFDKFDSMSDLRLDLIDALVKKGIDVNITLNLDGLFLENRKANDLAIFDRSYKLFDDIRAISVVKIHDIDKKREYKINPEIDHLLNNFERFDRNVMDDAYLATRPSRRIRVDGKNKTLYNLKNIKIFEHSTTVKEIENTALFIQRAIKKEDARYRDFAIYITDMDVYEDEISKIFNRNNLPFFMDESRRLSENHIVRTFMAGLRIVLFDYRPEDIKYFLTSSILLFPKNQNLEVSSLINYIEDRNIKGHMFTNDKYFTMDEDFYANQFGKDSARYQDKVREYYNINDIRSRVLELLDDLAKIKDGQHPTSLISKTIFEFITADTFINGISNYQYILEENGYLANQQENQQAVDKFIEILDQLVGVMGDREISLKTAYDLIDASSANSKIGLIPPTKDHIIVTDLNRSSIAARPNNFILGLNDAYFPSANKKSNIITNKEAEDLKNPDINFDAEIFNEDIEQRELRDLFKIFSISKNIYLSYAKGDIKGENLAKASVLNQISDMFVGIDEIDTTLYDYDEIKYSKDLTEKYILEKIKDIEEGYGLDDRTKEIIRAYMTYIRERENRYDSQLIDDYELIVDGLTYSNDKNRLDKDITDKIFAKNTWSASQIDRYARCPYQHFIYHGIRPSERDDYKVNPLEEGNIVHNLFEDMSKIFINRDLDDLPDFDDDLFKEILSKHMDQIRIADPRNSFVLENIAENTKKNYGYIKDHLEKGKFKVAGVEERFGDEDDAIYKAVDLGNGDVLAGRIDRIDQYIDPDGKRFVRIIDYKTGSKNFSIANILNLIDLQLVIYVMSVAYDEDSGAVPLGAFYLPLKDKIEAYSGSYNELDLKESDYKNHRMDGLITDFMTDYGLANSLDEAGKVDREEFFRVLDEDATGVKSVRPIKLYKNDQILLPAEAEELMAFVKESVAEMIRDIRDGEISLIPVVDGNPHCSFCAYRSICKIDPTIDSHRYREIDKSLKIEDIKERGASDE